MNLSMAKAGGSPKPSLGSSRQAARLRDCFVRFARALDDGEGAGLERLAGPGPGLPRVDTVEEEPGQLLHGDGRLFGVEAALVQVVGDGDGHVHRER